jgi:lipoprotein-anchoring transpeptidase ErfK/SrfK
LINIPRADISSKAGKFRRRQFSSGRAKVETIKTAFVVLLLLAVLYGVYVVLNKPELTPPPDVAWENEAAPQVEIGAPGDVDGPASATLGGQPFADSQTPITANPSFGAQDAPQSLMAEVTDSPAPGAMEPLVPDTRVGSPPGLSRVPQEIETSEGNDAQLAAATVEADRSNTAAVIEDTISVGDAEVDQRDSAYLKSAEASVTDDAEIRSIRTYDSAWNSAVGYLEKGQWADALFTLSVFYNDPDLTGEERGHLVDLLDPLAGKAIYSTEHVLEPPYEVQPGDTLQSVADRYQVPATLLQKINGIANPDSLEPGTQMKVVRGPFRAEVDLQKSELVVFLGKYYAGRFSISVGNDPKPDPAEYQVRAKQQGREYFAPDGTEIPPNAPDNPYGSWWIDLGGDVCLHASPDSLPSHGGLGCVSLRTADAADLYGILSIGSKVSVR